MTVSRARADLYGEQVFYCISSCALSLYICTVQLDGIPCSWIISYHPVITRLGVWSIVSVRCRSEFCTVLLRHAVMYLILDLRLCVLYYLISELCVTRLVS